MGDNTALIGVDWGLSHLRAYRIGARGRLLDVRRTEAGIASVRGRAFDTVLGSAISDWLGADAAPILLCGMIGSRQGWKEAPYACCPICLDALSQGLVRVESALGDVRIVGGARTKGEQGRYDLMRGEETQILGLPDTDRRTVITPGTHSKWSCLDEGAILDFRTYMTGELYALLVSHSTLGWAIRQPAKADMDEDSFQLGVRDAFADPDMPHGLFNARALAILEPEQAQNISSYLSGLLIGYEIHGGTKLALPDPIVIIGTARLARLYKLALAMAGRTDVELADADTVTAKGLWRIWQRERTLA